MGQASQPFPPPNGAACSVSFPVSHRVARFSAAVVVRLERKVHPFGRHESVTETVRVASAASICCVRGLRARVPGHNDQPVGNSPRTEILKIVSFVTLRDIWNEYVTRCLRTDKRACPFSNCLSYPRSLSWADSDVLTRCRARFSSKSCHFSDHPLGHSMRSSAGGRKPPSVKAGSMSVKAGMRCVGSPSQGSASSCPRLRRPPKERRASKSETSSAR